MNPLQNKITAPAMTREEWEQLPENVKHFLPWERMRRPETIKKTGAPDKALRVIVRAAKGQKHA